MKKVLFCSLFIFISSNAFAQWEGFNNLFAPKAPVKNSNSYKFIQPPKDKKQGNFRVNCFLPSGTSIPEFTNLQIRQIETGFTNYTFTKMDGKVAIAPVDFCYITQN